jgi:hypothetical protein
MFSTLMLLGLLFATYKLAQFNEKHPGKLLELGKTLWQKWLSNRNSGRN